jgi:ankyrin repeat protein
VKRITSIQRLLPLAFSVVLMGAVARLPLIDAIRSGDKDAVRALLQKGANANAAEGDGTTALHWASHQNDLDAADLLIRARANVNAANDLGVTPLWNAAENGSEPMVRRLLAAGANPNGALIAGETPVMIAARTGNPAVVELLLAKGGNPNVHGARGQTALMWAVSQKHPEVVKVLLAHGADIKPKSEVWSEMMAVPPHGYPDYNKMIAHGGETALMFAARVGDLASAKLLVAAGANVNDADAWGVSAVTLAEHSGFGDLVEFLLDKGADPNAYPNGFNALHEAIMRRDEKAVAALLAHKADPNLPLRTWTPTRRTSHDWSFDPELVGATPYWLAARFSQPNVMRLLVKYGADPLFVHHGDHVVEGRGGEAWEHKRDVTNAVMAATGMGGGAAWVEPERSQREALTLETVKLAAELGSDINLANTDGRTPLDGARNLRYETVVKFLTDKGAKAGTGGAGGRGSRGR